MLTTFFTCYFHRLSVVPLPGMCLYIESPLFPEQNWTYLILLGALILLLFIGAFILLVYPLLKMDLDVSENNEFLEEMIDELED